VAEFKKGDKVILPKGDRFGNFKGERGIFERMVTDPLYNGEERGMVCKINLNIKKTIFVPELLVEPDKSA
jgi:hypothetical protein